MRVPHVFMIPNFVNTEAFKPAEDADCLTPGCPQPRVAEPAEQQQEMAARFPDLLQNRDLMPRLSPSQGRDREGHEPLKVDTGLASGLRSQVSALKAELGIPGSAFVIGCVAALKTTHKRLDVLIREVAGLQNDKVFLLLAGALTDETSDIELLAERLLPGRHLILKNQAFEAMPDVYRCMDLYVHPAAEEIFGICLLEAMACGVPVVAHNSEVLKWVVGGAGGACETAGFATTKNTKDTKGTEESSQIPKYPSTQIATEQLNNLTTSPNDFTTGLLEGRGGWCVDVMQKGALAEMMMHIRLQVAGCRLQDSKKDLATEQHRNLTTPPHDPTTEQLNNLTTSPNDLATEQPLSLREIGERARRHVEEMFSVEAVVPQMVSMYHRVLKDNGE